MNLRRLRAACALAALLLAPAPGVGQKRKLSVEDLTAEPPLAGRPVTAVAWLDGGARFSYIVRKGAGDAAVSELWLEETATGRKRMVVSTTPPEHARLRGRPDESRKAVRAPDPAPPEARVPGSRVAQFTESGNRPVL